MSIPYLDPSTKPGKPCKQDNGVRVYVSQITQFISFNTSKINKK